MQFTDSVTLSQPRMTRDGYMVVDARIARTGLQTYRGSEIDKPAIDIVTIYRPDAEVFSSDAMGSFSHRPVTIDHPAELVSSANWKKHSVGMTGDSVTRDGDFVKVPFTLMDSAAIETVRAGTRELSCGYTSKLDWTPGVTDTGERYDAVMRNIRGNHLAVVDRGRAGATCRIGDSWTTEQPQKEPAMADLTRAVMVDGVSYQMPDQGAQIVDRLQGQIAANTSTVAAKDGEIAALRAGHQTALDGKTGQIAALESTHRSAIEAKDGEIAALKAQIPDQAALDALIVTRTRTIDSARLILGDSMDPVGKSDGEIRRLAVAKRLGDAQVTGKSDDYVSAAFDTLSVIEPGSHRDPIRDALQHPAPQPGIVTDGSKAYDAMTAQLRDAWKTPVINGAV